jgi:hypothetical protein
MITSKVTMALATTIGACGVLAQATGPGAMAMPDLNWISNLTATGAVVWLALRTIPATVKDFREENRLKREDREKERAHVICNYPPRSNLPAP